MKSFWDERYKAESYVYGEAPNAFFASSLSGLKPGKILLPAEGEGRNAVFAAKSGWEVHAFDWSEEGLKKGEKLADREKVHISYRLGAMEDVHYEPETFDALGLVFAHFPESDRRAYHQKLGNFLKPGGYLILEGFSKAHLRFSAVNPKAGGPKNEGMLFSLAEIQRDFTDFEWEVLEEVNDSLEEGSYHMGEAALIRAFGRKKKTNKKE
ncbi:Methyltransferase domain-containing protein [Cyclobacterium lianum]|uniref:Methyltransferase domain-containing protein n=1 Tax=Cyclobacterium lianum TaxID=388280 RepID=A0A1M7QEG7_9BACT|nr:class I SAM-dependent methyltransferase [Cyclobacterium lianum]SHN29326.1 Methyltransferase domain-containing protein [Cyclobacterium lianum]